MTSKVKEKLKVSKKLMQNYHINVFYSKDDGSYIADIPDLNCSAFGETPGQALEEVLRAKDAWLAAARVLKTMC